jgi:hypothetical protein
MSVMGYMGRGSGLEVIGVTVMCWVRVYMDLGLLGRGVRRRRLDWLGLKGSGVMATSVKGCEL